MPPPLLPVFDGSAPEGGWLLCKLDHPSPRLGHPLPTAGAGRGQGRLGLDGLRGRCRRLGCRAIDAERLDRINHDDGDVTTKGL